MSPELIQVFLNGGGHAILGVAVIVLWQKVEKMSKVISKQSGTIGSLEARLNDCEREAVAQARAYNRERTARGDKPIPFNPPTNN